MVIVTYVTVCMITEIQLKVFVLCQIKFFPNIVKMMSLISLVCSECSIAMKCISYVVWICFYQTWGYNSVFLKIGWRSFWTFWEVIMAIRVVLGQLELALLLCLTAVSKFSLGEKLNFMLKQVSNCDEFALFKNV